MKRIIFFCAAVLALSACSNNDDLSFQVSEATRSSFQEMYPGAKGVNWDKRGIYKVALFNYNGNRLSAWYNQDGDWCMTEQRMNIDEAPTRVMNAYRLASRKSNDANYVDKLTRDGIEDIYVVVEGNGSALVEYYYAVDGTAVKTLDNGTRIHDDYRSEIVPQVASPVYSTTRQLYPEALIMEVDVLFPGILYLTIIHESSLKSLEFSLTGAWTMSMWTVTEDYVRKQCPEVYNALHNAGYGDGCRIVSVDFYESPSSAFYSFLLNNNGAEENLRISEAGTVLPNN